MPVISLIAFSLIGATVMVLLSSLALIVQQERHQLGAPSAEE